MAVKGNFQNRVEINLQELGFVLRSTLCEWLLLFLLLLDAAFSYCITKFARYCELELPCVLCSRRNHVSRKQKPDFYNGLLCNDHKFDLSSLILCQDHHKLSEINEICEECLLSFAKKETNEETYRLLLGKLTSECLKPFFSMETKECSCCFKSWKNRPNVQKVVHCKPSVSISKPDIPLPKSPRFRSLNRQEGLKKKKNRFSSEYDALSRLGYSEVKMTSDSESDFPLSDDDDIIIPQSSEFFQKMNKPVNVNAARIILRGEIEREKGETTTPTFFTPNGKSRRSLSDLNWERIPKNFGSEVTALDEIPISSSCSVGVNVQILVNLSKENGLDTTEKGDSNKQASSNHNWESIDLNAPTKKTAAIITRSFSDNDPRDFSGYRNLSFDKNTENGEVDKDKPQIVKSRSLVESRVVSNSENSSSFKESESTISKLREENEDGKKRISELYKELEEERNAATIAANQAMAMITKLQEEKAALYMEALQYLRMMEEQAEYDVDELEKANELIAEKEKEIQDLQAELDYFRIKYPEEFLEDSENVGIDLEEDGESSCMETGEEKL